MDFGASELVLPALIGFYFHSYDKRHKLVIGKLNSQRLIFQSLLFGFSVTLFFRILLFVLNYFELFFPVNSNPLTIVLIKYQSEIFSVLATFAITFLRNRFVKEVDILESAAFQSTDSVFKTLAIAALKNKQTQGLIKELRKLSDRKIYIESVVSIAKQNSLAVKAKGKPSTEKMEHELILLSEEIDRTQKELFTKLRFVMVELYSSKVYIGTIHGDFISEMGSPEIYLLPYFSGKRLDNGEVAISSQYVDFISDVQNHKGVHPKWGIEQSDLGIALRLQDIQNVRIASLALFQNMPVVNSGKQIDHDSEPVK